MPSSSLIEVGVEVEVGIEVEVGVEVEIGVEIGVWGVGVGVGPTFSVGWVGLVVGDLESKANLNSSFSFS